MIHWIRDFPDGFSQPPKTVAQSRIDRKRGRSVRFGGLGCLPTTARARRAYNATTAFRVVQVLDAHNWDSTRSRFRGNLNTALSGCVHSSCFVLTNFGAALSLSAALFSSDAHLERLEVLQVGNDSQSRPQRNDDISGIMGLFVRDRALRATDAAGHA